MNNTSKQKELRGFTLLELLIVIAIIAILSVILIIVINPAETLKKSRDVQRMSDLNTLKTAIGLMLTATSTPSLDGTFGAVAGTCITTGSGATNLANAEIFYSTLPAGPCSALLAAGADAAFAGNFGGGCSAGSGAVTTVVDGTGWVPVNFSALSGGSPISNLPVDPTNTVAAVPAATDLVYRYACQNGSSVAGKPAFSFELNAVLESSAYTVDDNKMTKDGGDNTNKYEVGTSVKLLPITGVAF